MIDNEIIKALECCSQEYKCTYCPFEPEYPYCSRILTKNVLEFINRQQAEIERLKDEASKARRKALLEASSKFAGHSDYHGDTILCKLICMAEGKEVEIAKPLDKSKIKSEAIKEFAKKVKENLSWDTGYDDKRMFENDIDNLVKEMVGDAE